MVGAPLEVAAGAWTPAPTSITVPLARRRCRDPRRHRRRLRAHARRQGQGPDRRGDRPAERLHRRARRRSPPPPSPPGPSSPRQLPTIQGVPEVGTTLTLTPSAWSPQPTKAKTQWYADGARSSRGHRVVARPSAATTSARSISARVIASARATGSRGSTAPETAPVLAKPVAIIRPSRIKGAPQVARRLVAEGRPRPAHRRVGHLRLAPRRPTHRQGHAPHLHGPSGGHRPRPVRPGHAGPGATSAARRRPVAVASPVTTVPEVRVRTDATRERVAVDIRVQRPRSAEAGRRDHRQRRRTDGRGPARQTAGRGLVVRDVRPGTKPVVVRYAGTDVVQPAVSRSSVTVPKRNQS